MNSRMSKDLYNEAQVKTSKAYPWVVLQTLAYDHRHSLTKSEYDHVVKIVRSRSIQRYESLAEEWGPQSNSPESLAIGNFLAKYQMLSLLKKFQFVGDKQKRRQAAVDKFLAAEQVCGDMNRRSYDGIAEACSGDLVMRSMLLHMRSFCSKVLGDALPQTDKLTEWSRHGPGANLDTKDGFTSSYDKYNNYPYSCTEQAAGFARSAIEDDQRWFGALEDKYREDRDIPKHAILDWDTFWRDVIQIVPGNRISFVPKNSRTDRSIAIEPTLNLYLQLGVDGFIRRRLKRWGIDLDDQRKNQRLALLGSRYWDGPDPFVTLDLAAASDTVSLCICEMLLPFEWCDYLKSIRSPQGALDDEVIVYEKISSMGNGFTFALESLLFAAVVYAAQAVGGHKVNPDEYAIFGDDIVCRRSVSDRVVKMLGICGFSVNSEKSFFEGAFRESCGADFLAGIPVRPVFLTEHPATVFDLWCDLNRLRRHLALRRGDEWDSRVCDEIRSWIPERFQSLKGPVSDETFDTYEHVPLPHVRQRDGFWNYATLCITAKRRRGKCFLMRKLMHSLRNTPDTAVPPWFSKAMGKFKQRGIQAGKGSRFTVTGGIACTVSVSPAITSVWCSQYTERQSLIYLD